jgi:antitoxin Xre/MbcA/ParS-like protein
MSMAALRADRGLVLDPERVRALLKGFFGIMERWGVDNAGARIILGAPAERTYFKWKAGEGGTVPLDTVRRIGYVSGIWKALEIVYADAHQADSWVHRPNAFFGGQAPLERMTAGDVTDLAAVRQYIDAARAPWS